jgi:hypothetical protein
MKAKPKDGWAAVKCAPIGIPVLIAVPPLPISESWTVLARMEVGIARDRGDRSGRAINLYASTCRWTSLPKYPSMEFCSRASRAGEGGR